MNKDKGNCTNSVAAFFKSGPGRAFFIVLVIAMVLGLCAGINKSTVQEKESEQNKEETENNPLIPIINAPVDITSGAVYSKASTDKGIENPKTVRQLTLPGAEEQKQQRAVNTNPPAEQNPKTEAEALVKKIYETADITDGPDGVVLSYSQPKIPEKFHLSVKAGVYSSAGATLARFVSDSGWLTHPENYDASEKTVLEKLDVEDLDNKMFILQIRITEDAEGTKSISTVYQLTQDCNGTRTLQTSVF